MTELIREFEELSWLKKLILAFFPFAWNLYRLAKAIEKKDVGGIILAVVFFMFFAPVMVFDIVFIMIKKQVWWF